MTELEKLYSDILDVLETFKYVELNSQILTRYANPNKINLDNIKDLENYYMSPETQNVFELISDDLMDTIEDLRNKLLELRDNDIFDNSDIVEINNVKDRLNKLLDE